MYNPILTYPAWITFRPELVIVKQWFFCTVNIYYLDRIVSRLLLYLYLLRPNAKCFRRKYEKNRADGI